MSSGFCRDFYTFYVASLDFENLSLKDTHRPQIAEVQQRVCFGAPAKEIWLSQDVSKSFHEYWLSWVMSTGLPARGSEPSGPSI